MAEGLVVGSARSPVEEDTIKALWQKRAYNNSAGPLVPVGSLNPRGGMPGSCQKTPSPNHKSSSVVTHRGVINPSEQDGRPGSPGSLAQQAEAAARKTRSSTPIAPVSPGSADYTMERIHSLNARVVNMDARMWDYQQRVEELQVIAGTNRGVSRDNADNLKKMEERMAFLKETFHEKITEHIGLVSSPAAGTLQSAEEAGRACLASLEEAIGKRMEVIREELVEQIRQARQASEQSPPLVSPKARITNIEQALSDHSIFIEHFRSRTKNSERGGESSTSEESHRGCEFFSLAEGDPEKLHGFEDAALRATAEPQVTEDVVAQMIDAKIATHCERWAELKDRLSGLQDEVSRKIELPVGFAVEELRGYVSKELNKLAAQTQTLEQRATMLEGDRTCLEERAAASEGDCCSRLEELSGSLEEIRRELASLEDWRLQATGHIAKVADVDRWPELGDHLSGLREEVIRTSELHVGGIVAELRGHVSDELKTLVAQLKTMEERAATSEGVGRRLDERAAALEGGQCPRLEEHAGSLEEIRRELASVEDWRLQAVDQITKLSAQDGHEASEHELQCQIKLDSLESQMGTVIRTSELHVGGIVAELRGHVSDELKTLVAQLKTMEERAATSEGVGRRLDERAAALEGGQCPRLEEHAGSLEEIRSELASVEEWRLQAAFQITKLSAQDRHEASEDEQQYRAKLDTLESRMFTVEGASAKIADIADVLAQVRTELTPLQDGVREVQHLSDLVKRVQEQEQISTSRLELQGDVLKESRSESAALADELRASIRQSAERGQAHIAQEVGRLDADLSALHTSVASWEKEHSSTEDRTTDRSHEEGACKAAHDEVLVRGATHSGGSEAEHVMLQGRKVLAADIRTLSSTVAAAEAAVDALAARLLAGAGEVDSAQPELLGASADGSLPERLRTDLAAIADCMAASRGAMGSLLPQLRSAAGAASADEPFRQSLEGAPDGLVSEPLAARVREISERVRDSQAAVRWLTPELVAHSGAARPTADRVRRRPRPQTATATANELAPPPPQPPPGCVPWASMLPYLFPQAYK